MISHDPSLRFKLHGRLSRTQRSRQSGWIINLSEVGIGIGRWKSFVKKHQGSGANVAVKTCVPIVILILGDTQQVYLIKYQTHPSAGILTVRLTS